ncbi:MAG: protein tyrosine phosphatase, partial [Pseudomonadota bacterium]
ETILGANKLFESIEYPALMHCKSGADRAGLMSVFYKIFREGRPVDQATRQLSLKYLHVRQGKTGILDAFFDAYLADTARRPEPFLDWVARGYDPAKLKADFLKTWRARSRLDVLLGRE